VASTKKAILGFGSAFVVVAVLGFSAYLSGPYADQCRIALLPTILADIAINGVHASGGIVSETIALAASVLVYGLMFWGLITLVTLPRKRPNQPPQPTAPSRRA
jgi:hypothetical protein